MVEPPGIPISEEGPDVPWGARVVTWPGYQGGAHRCCGWAPDQMNMKKIFRARCFSPGYLLFGLNTAL